MAVDFKSTVYLSDVVKMACADLNEDYTKNELRFESFAFRGLKELTNQMLNLGVRREIVPIHHNTNTANIPCDAKAVLFVGIINDCGEKIELTENGNIVGNVEKKECVDKCKSCGEDVDVCANLIVTLEEKNITINNVTYKEKNTKRLIGNEYFQILETFYYDVELNSVVPRKEKKFLTLIETNDCGCVKSTPQNIKAIKENCDSCYTCCFAPCIKFKDDIAHYKVSLKEGLIHFSKGINYDSVYIEYQAGFPKENGKILVPDYAAEVINYYVKWKYYEHKFGARAERIDAFQMYKKEKQNMKLSIRKLPLEQIVRILHRTPTFALNMTNDNCITSANGINSIFGNTKSGNENTTLEINNNLTVNNENDIAYDGWGV